MFGQIGSLLELLNGKLSESVMHAVCHQQRGFSYINEINLSCSCPDWAVILKHVAGGSLWCWGAFRSCTRAALLRGVNHEELIDVSAAIMDATQKAKRPRIDDAALSEIFSISETKKKHQTKPSPSQNKKIRYHPPLSLFPFI